VPDEEVFVGNKFLFFVKMCTDLGVPLFLNHASATQADGSVSAFSSFLEAISDYSKPEARGAAVTTNSTPSSRRKRKQNNH
jgi:hypothetical protein